MNAHRIALALCLVGAASAAQAVVVNYSYTTAPMDLVPVAGGYSAPGFYGTLPQQQTFTFGFSVDLDALGGRIANTQISVTTDWTYAVYATAVRNGQTIATQDPYQQSWFSSSFPTETFGSRLLLDFDSKGDVSSWAFGTDGESASYSFGSPTGDFYVFASILNWQPAVPVWYSIGPGTWTHDALPSQVPLPASGLTLFAALGGVAAFGRHKVRKLTPQDA